MTTYLHDFPQPTPEEVEMTKRVEQALANEINLLAREGVPVGCVLSALSMTIANVITTAKSFREVPGYFETRAAMFREVVDYENKAN